ncbi:MAG: NfeD family protein, partial [Planctomycetota bacterium]
PLGRVLVSSAPTADEVAPDDDRRELLGRFGVARTKMLPAGSVEVDGAMLDAVAQGQAIEPGESVRVFEVRGNRVVVRRAPGDPGPDRGSEAPRETPDIDSLGIDALGIDAIDFTPPEGRQP